MEMVAVTRLFCKQTELMTKRPHLVALGMTQSMLSAKVAQWMVARPKTVSNCFFGGLEFVSDSPDQGVVTTITDFVPGEDVLVLPLEIDTAGSGGDTPITFEIVQADDDSYTDTIFSAVYPAATSTETAITSTATIRLLCTTNLTIADVTQANLEHSRFDDF